MKTSALARFRQKLAADQSVYGLWVTLESPSISEMAVALGVDWIVVDAEHGHLDWKEILEHIRAAVRSETVVLVRVAELNAGLIKRALDLGADGIVVPWIETAEQLDRAVAAARYAPEGFRGIGAERATAWGEAFLQHAQEANENVLVVPLIETVTAGRNLAQLCACRGAEVYFLGPADYSATAGFRGQWEGPGVGEELRRIKDALRAAGKHCGVVTTSQENLIERRLDGFRMLGLGLDSGLLLRGLHAALGAVGQDRRLLPSLAPAPAALPPTPLPAPPVSLRPDRPEVMHQPGANPPLEVAPGVRLDCQVGAHNQARNLTTGIVHFGPGAVLPCHTHTFGETITVLVGSMVVAVEGREYTLGPLDNIVIPRGLAHLARNVSASSSAQVHVALASQTPARELVATAFPVRAMPADSAGQPGRERVTRFATAPRYAAGPGTSFIDHFNRELTPGFEMSGGYGLFQPGGRLPAHVHTFDESIFIAQGTATCVVEGRRYALGQNATALQPRGRVHYFINESPGPMAMLWTYAGPVPERIVIDERCTTIDGDPWRDRPAGA